MEKRLYRNYNDFIHSLYSPNMEDPSLVRSVTFVVTEACNLRCTYCYEINKGNKMMSESTAKKAVDMLFKMYDDDDGTFINKKTKAVILEFIGGEELLNIPVIEATCDYFIETCLQRHHPWLYTFKISMITNGTLYFSEDFQRFLKKYSDFLSFSITIDGPKEIHDSCRLYPDGTGSFDDAYKAFRHFNENYGKISGTKVTISPENLKDMNRIIDFFIDEGVTDINANTTYEAEWTEEHGRLFYQELKKMADKLLTRNKVYVSLFDNIFFKPKDKDDLQNWCGGAGKMLAVGTDGICYPCIRYMPYSLGNKVAPVIIGNIDTGIYKTEEDKATGVVLSSINRRTKSTDECFNCPVAFGCSDCEAWNYQSAGGKFNVKNTNICNMHKARSLANVYYWNKKGIPMKMYLPKEEALKYIDEEEYNMLFKLSEKGVDV